MPTSRGCQDQAIWMTGDRDCRFLHGSKICVRCTECRHHMQWQSLRGPGLEVFPRMFDKILYICFSPISQVQRLQLNGLIQDHHHRKEGTGIKVPPSLRVAGTHTRRVNQTLHMMEEGERCRGGQAPVRPRRQIILDNGSNRALTADAASRGVSLVQNRVHPALTVVWIAAHQRRDGDTAAQ